MNIDQLWIRYLNIPESELKDTLSQMNDYYTYYLINMIKKEFIQQNIKLSTEDVFNIIELSLNSKNAKNKNKLFSLKDLSTIGFNLCNLTIFSKLHTFLSYYNDEYYNQLNFDFNIKEIQNRIVKYSYNFINNNFPFKPYNYIIAGGFILNSIIGINSDYSDIDIYIFNDFRNSIIELINYFKTIADIHMTYNKSIVNIYPVGFKINIQIINVDGLSPEKIITDFDLSYSQIALINWTTIKLTFPAYKTLITGLFTINRNAIIRNYRIIKGYVKGFKLDPLDYKKILSEPNDDTFQFNLLNEVKKLMSQLCESFNNQEKLEKILFEYLDKNSNDFKLMTKSIYLTNQLLETYNKKELIEYLETTTNYKYLESFETVLKEMEPIKCFINYDSSFDISAQNTDINNYPNIYYIDYVQNNHYLYCKTINDDIIMYKLYVETGSYYKNYKPLNYYSISINCNLEDLKLTSFTDNLIKFEIPFKNNIKLKNLIIGLDSRFYFIGDKIYRTTTSTTDTSSTSNNIYNFKKNIQTELQDTLNIVTSPSIFIKNLIYIDDEQNKKNILTYNKDLKKIKKFIISDLKMQTNTQTHFTLNKIKQCNDIIKLKLCIEGILYNKKYNYYSYQLKIISIQT
jgi:hypothetical protein